MPVHALGIDLGGTKIEAMLLSAQGTELWRRRIATPAGDYDATLRAIDLLVVQAAHGERRALQHRHRHARQPDAPKG